jgi:hypothetical protein
VLVRGTRLGTGKSFKSLKRYLQTKYGMTPAEYRAKWGLRSDYRMVAPNAARSELAKGMELGLLRKKPDPVLAQSQNVVGRLKSPSQCGPGVNSGSVWIVPDVRGYGGIFGGQGVSAFLR